MLLQYDNGLVRTRRLEGYLRSLAWSPIDSSLVLVGNYGMTLRIDEEKTTNLAAPTKQNLRALSINPLDGRILIVGNTGTILLFDKDDGFSKIDASTTENLRAVSWDPKGRMALIAGNAGTLLKYSSQTIETIDDGRANLRHISWRPAASEALITSNCFAEEFIPSANLFTYDANKGIVTPVNEGRVDLMGADWNPIGESAIVVGYDVVWHTGFIGGFKGKSLSPIQFENKRVYPVAVAWDPSGEIVAIVTAAAQLGMGNGSLYLWDGQSMKVVYSNEEFFFSAVAWNLKTKRLAAIASTSTRTFNC